MNSLSNVDCPVDFVQVNEYRARITAAFVFLLSAGFLLTGHWLIPAFLCLDFFQRSFFDGKFSLLAMCSQGIEKLFRVPFKATDRAPKRFAAQLGFMMSDMILIFVALDLSLAAQALAAIMLLFSFLESVLGFCAGCYVYSFLQKIKKG